MKKKISVLLMVLVMVLSATVTSYAAVGDEVMPRNTGSVDFMITRTSATSANANIFVNFTSEADEYSVVVYLQKLSNGVWSLDTTNPDYVFFNNGINSITVPFSHRYNSLSNGTTYRLMVVSRDINSAGETRSTVYSNPF